METQKIVFTNKELNLRIASLLRLPGDFNLSDDYPAVIVDGSMLSLKEQVQSAYAERLTELGYVTLVFDHVTRSSPASRRATSRPRSTSSRAFRSWTASASAAWASAAAGRTCRSRA